MLGNVARDLRLLGFDTLFERDAADTQLLRIAQADGRVLVTRDQALAGRARNVDCVLVTEGAPSSQAVKVLRELELTPAPGAAFTRCLSCNQLLEPLSREEAAGWVPDHLTAAADRYRRCTACRRVYWRGSHVARLEAKIRVILDSLHPAGGPV